MLSNLPQKLTEIETLPDTVGRLAELDLAKELPWFGLKVFHNELGAYVVAAVTFVLYWALLYAFRHYLILRLERQAKAKPQSLWHYSLGLAHEIKRYILPLLALYAALQPLTLNASVERVLKLVTVGLLTLQVVRLAGELCRIVIAYARGGFAVDDPVVRNTNNNLTTLAKVAVWAAGLLFFLDNAGFNVSTFIAGLGIGGVAIALAAQAILGDTFSSFAIALDKPFEAGDFISVDALNGTVEHIGLKTTRVRSVGGELLVFANSDLTKSRVRNFKQMQHRHADLKLFIHPQTKLGLIKEIPGILTTIISAQEDVAFEYAAFTSIDKAALIFEASYTMKTADFAVFAKTRETINLAVLEAFASRGIAMAFEPNATMTFAND